MLLKICSLTYFLVYSFLCIKYRGPCFLFMLSVYLVLFTYVYAVGSHKSKNIDLCIYIRGFQLKE